MIKVILSDDHRMMLEGLRATLQRVSESEGFSIVGTASSFNELRDIYSDQSDAVLVMDLSFRNEEQSGLSFCREVLKNNQQAKLVIFSQNDDEYCIQSAYRMGVLGYVRKDEDEFLIEAIKSVALGRKYISPAISFVLASNSTSQMNPLHLPEHLKSLFVLIADGFTKDEAAEKLGVTGRTVHRYMTEIQKTTGVSSDADITKIAIKYGLISAEVNPKK